MKIKAFDAVVLRKLQPEIEAALAALGRRHGITIRAGTARFRESTAELKLELAVIGGDGRAARREEHRLVGLAPNRPKYPIVMERLRDGKVVLCTEDVIEKITALRLLKPS